MRIGFVLDDDIRSPNGVQQIVEQLGRWLQREGHTVAVFCADARSGGGLGQSFETHFVASTATFRFNGNRVSAAVWPKHVASETKAAIRSCDVLHVQAPYGPLVGGRVVRLARSDARVVAAFHMAPRSPSVALLARLFHKTLRASAARVDAVVCDSPASQTFMREVWRRRGSIIPNPAQCVEPAALRSKGTSSQSSRVVFLGRLVARKGADHLLDAVESLPLETMSQLSVIVVGDGPLRRRLQRRVAASSTLRNVVSFSGYVSEAAKWHLLSEADIAVFPATGAESFGMVLLEAMVADCAIVAYANDGYAFVLRGVPSALVPSASTTSLAERIRLLHHSPTERMRQVSEQRKALPQYDVAEIGRQYLELYAASRH